jgi:hypothetical protein
MTDTGPERNYVIVLLHGECERDPGDTCVMSVLGPYTRDEADEAFRQQPAWAAPHRMGLTRD